MFKLFYSLFIRILLSLFIIVGLSGFTYLDEDAYHFDINDLYDYTKEFKSEEIGVCSMSSVKSYMDYRMVTLRTSNQYRFLNYECMVDRKTGLLYDEDGFIYHDPNTQGNLHISYELFDSIYSVSKMALSV